MSGSVAQIEWKIEGISIGEWLTGVSESLSDLFEVSERAVCSISCLIAHRERVAIVGRKLGVFGGTFDPIHLAHLIVAEQAREQLELDALILLPAAIPPHKQRREITDGKHRLEMARLAVAGNPAFDVSDLELRREGVSYTVDTLRWLHEQHPDDELFLLLGADSLSDLPNWYRPDEIRRLATLAVAGRPRSPSIESPHSHHSPTSPGDSSNARVIDIPLMDISSTEIRNRVASRRSIRYMVPAAVEAYIAAHGLYRANGGG